MQEASGVSFEEYVQQKVLQPLGMKSTLPPICHPERQPAGRAGSRRGFGAKFYSRNRLGFRKAIPVNNFYKLAGGGYLSTSTDIAKFGQAHLDKSVLKEEISSQFLTSGIVDGKPTYYGLGWQVSEDKKGRSFYGHIGNGVGGYSNLFIYPKEQMVFSILVNCTNPKVQDVLDEVIDTMIF
jgi:serine beta-lactamase-like protein LACTB, mitochondrial